MVYTFNSPAEREVLWSELAQIRRGGPWIMMGDFNNVLRPTERIGNPVQLFEIQSFQHCVALCDMQDLPNTGMFFTWTNKQEG
ncbi:hypothetical protein vseg_006230 [Gypsophila vaccaria]